ncbi:hypothetical protein A0H81_08697 [Grifola frondosa]|uniref:Uncharacterized protein n=1 Tax=Grifola frondosa TaxID=5627 RepID=A0A1C7M3M7_GRIFR|nr:hypothetical protein A0H81_08697 [Grifola frondosa]
MPHFHHILASDPQYAPPLMRAASPSSTIDQDAFERKCLDRLRLNVPRPDEVKANIEPLLQPRPIVLTKNSRTAGEALHEQVMNNLRERVRQLEEDELFEQTVLRGTRLSEEEQPSSTTLTSLCAVSWGFPLMPSPAIILVEPPTS